MIHTAWTMKTYQLLSTEQNRDAYMLWIAFAATIYNISTVLVLGKISWMHYWEGFLKVNIWSACRAIRSIAVIRDHWKLSYILFTCSANTVYADGFCLLLGRLMALWWQNLGSVLIKDRRLRVNYIFRWLHSYDSFQEYVNDRKYSVCPQISLLVSVLSVLEYLWWTHGPCDKMAET